MRKFGNTNGLIGTGDIPIPARYPDCVLHSWEKQRKHQLFVPLRRTGQFHYVPGAETHYNDPHGITMLQEAARTDSRKAYRRYAKHLDKLNRGVTLRGMLRFVEDQDRSIPVDECEPVSEIVKRFCTGAMSLGSISANAHETLAIAMNQLGAKSNSGEGGEESH